MLCALFHLANAAMLTSVGQLLTHLSGKDHATSLIAVCIVAAQCVMVPVAMLVGAKADSSDASRSSSPPSGCWHFAACSTRFRTAPIWLVGVQCLDGVGAGVYGGAVPVVVADLTRGAGRFNASPGCGRHRAGHRRIARASSPG